MDHNYFNDPFGTLASWWQSAGPYIVLGVSLAAVTVVCVAVKVRRVRCCVAKEALSQSRWVQLLPPATDLGPKGSEDFWSAVGRLLPRASWRRAWWAPSIAFEMIWTGARLRIGVWVPGGVSARGVAHNAEAAWPGCSATITDVPTPLSTGKPGVVAESSGGWLMPSGGREWLALRTDHDADPLRAVLSHALRTDRDDYAVVQVVVRPATSRRLSRLESGALSRPRGWRGLLFRGAELTLKATNATVREIFDIFTPGTTPPNKLTVITRLTPRDRLLLRVLADHDVLTTDQIARIAFGSVRRAQDRLRVLVDLKILERFRRYLSAGSEAWRYVLAPLGAELVAAERGLPPPLPSRVRARGKSLAGNPRLDHLLGVNDFFTHLIAASRKSTDLALELWWSERCCGAEFGGIVRPDARGIWRDHSRRLSFFLECDKGTETTMRVAAKLNGYRDLALAEEKPILVLFCFSGPRRESAVRNALISSVGNRVAVATATFACGAPAEPVWLPLRGAAVRVALGSCRCGSSVTSLANEQAKGG